MAKRREKRAKKGDYRESEGDRVSIKNTYKCKVSYSQVDFILNVKKCRVYGLSRLSQAGFISKGVVFLEMRENAKM